MIRLGVKVIVLSLIISLAGCAPLKKDCLGSGGVWIKGQNECEYINRIWCAERRGIFHECGSACRHEVGEPICTKQCVPYCEF